MVKEDFKRCASCFDYDKALDWLRREEAQPPKQEIIDEVEREYQDFLKHRSEVK